jgi:hypothetical protein
MTSNVSGEATARIGNKLREAMRGRNPEVARTTAKRSHGGALGILVRRLTQHPENYQIFARFVVDAGFEGDKLPKSNARYLAFSPAESSTLATIVRVLEPSPRGASFKELTALIAAMPNRRR